MTKKFSLILGMVVATLLLLTVALAAYYWTLQALPRRDMMAYAPDNTAIYLEVNNLADLLEGIVVTNAWQQLAPAMGIPAQWRYAGDATKFLANTGLGPEEAVLLARAQYAAVVGGLEAQVATAAVVSARVEPPVPQGTKTDANNDIKADDNPDAVSSELEIVPKVAFLIETRTPAATVEKYWRGRVDMVARRIYEKVTRQTANYQQYPIEIWQAVGSSRQLIATRYESLIIVGNQQEIVERCLATCLQQRRSLQTEALVVRAREALAANNVTNNLTEEGHIFAYVAKSALTPLITLQGLWPAVVEQDNSWVNSQNSQRDQRDNQNKNNNQIKTESNNRPVLPANRSKEQDARKSIKGELWTALTNSLLQGIAYQGQFAQGKLVERFLVLLPSRVVTGLQAPITQAQDSQLAKLVPSTAKSLSVVRVSNLGQNLNQLLKVVAANSNVVVGFALREFTLDWGRRYGLELETAAAAIIDGPAMMIEHENGETTVAFGVKQQLPALALVKRYLQQTGGKINSTEYRGTEIVSNDQGRAAAFINQWLILTQLSTLQQIVDQLASNNAGSPLINTYSQMATTAPVVMVQGEDLTAAMAILRLSQLLRTTRGTRAVLQQPAVQQAIATLPPTISLIRLTDEGVLMERYSALGLIGTVLSLSQTPELQEVTVDGN
jgi:hypothetical protein